MKAIAREREALGWTKTELSWRARVQLSRICTIESGRAIPYEPELKRLARALKYKGDPADLLKDEGDCGNHA